jgi:methionine-rich copper-binding protein CopC
LPLKQLPPGRYRVTWHAVSVDTHRTEGKYNFLILP